MNQLLQAVSSLSKKDLIIRAPKQSNTCQEEKTSLNISNDTTNDMLNIRLDGGLYPRGDACDWLIVGMLRKSEARGGLLELKGRHIEKAIPQLETTIGKLKDSLRGCMPDLRTAMIVSKGGKIPMSKLQLKQKHFIKKYHIRLTRETNGSTKALSTVLK